MNSNVSMSVIYLFLMAGASCAMDTNTHPHEAEKAKSTRFFPISLKKGPAEFAYNHPVVSASCIAACLPTRFFPIGVLLGTFIVKSVSHAVLVNHDIHHTHEGWFFRYDYLKDHACNESHNE